MYQTLDTEGGYDPIAETVGTPRRSRKSVWIASLAVCGLIGLSGQTLTGSAVPQSSFDASPFMPKGNAMACLQSACNSAVAGIAMNYDDPSSRNLTSCLTFAGDAVTGGQCFGSKVLKTNPQALTLYICAVCKQCVPGDVSPARCAALSHGENDLRGAPSSTGGAYGFDYSHYVSGSPQATTLSSSSDLIPGTSALWTSFLAENPNVVPAAVVPTDTIPAVSDQVSSDLQHANDQADAGLTQADMSAKKRARIEHKINSALHHADKEASAGLERADNAILKANDKVDAKLSQANDKAVAGMEKGEAKEEAGIEHGEAKEAAGIEHGEAKEAAGIEHGEAKEAAGLEHADDKAAAGLQRADDQIEKHVDDNKNVPANVPSYIPELGTSDHPVSDTVPTSLNTNWDSKIGGTDVPWSKYLDGKKISREGNLHGGDPLEYVPLNLAAGNQAPRKPAKQTQEKRLMNACMQMSCNSAMAAVGSGIAGSPQVSLLARCIQGSKTPAAANECFKKFPSQQGNDLQTCMICQHCLPGTIPQDKCLALQRGPNDLRGP